MFESAAFESAAFEALTDNVIEVVISWSGDSEFEIIGTTPLIALIESGQGSLCFAAEIFLRSL